MTHRYASKAIVPDEPEEPPKDATPEPAQEQNNQNPPDLGVSVEDNSTAGEHFGP